MAQSARDLARLVELDELLVQVVCGFEGEHRRLAARDDDDVETVYGDHEPEG